MPFSFNALSLAMSSPRRRRRAMRGPSRVRRKTLDSRIRGNDGSIGRNDDSIRGNDGCIRGKDSSGRRNDASVAGHENSIRANSAPRFDFAVHWRRIALLIGVAFALLAFGAGIVQAADVRFP